METIKGLLFDKDGTLFDFHATWGAWAQLFFLEAAEGDDALAREMSRNLGYDFDEGSFRKDSIIIAGTPEEIATVINSHHANLTLSATIEKINRIASDVPQAEAAPLVPLLSRFRDAGFRLGVATNDAEAPAMAHLGKAGIVELLDFVAGFDSGFGAKPQPGMQHGFCARVGLRPEEVAMVGDSLHDLISGRAAGMMTIGVLTGLAEAEELAPHADVVLSHIGEIPDFLGMS